MRQKALLAGLVVAAVLGGGLAWEKDSVDYNADVKPILNKHCIGCHGGVKKAGGVSFLFEEEMYQPGKSGKVAVVKGDWRESEMIRRITTHDPDERMPKDGPALSEKEIGVLKEWISEGAKWGTHWSYQHVASPEVPTVNSWRNLFGLLGGDSKWVSNEIDHFVINKLRENGLRHSDLARRETLIRRVSLDLTGLPPTEAQVQSFLRNPSPDAYPQLVDSLLASPAFGERWASMWMDLARYADTKGYERDPSRTIWKYRDYVVNAFNADKPFDRFTIEQLAGDLLSGEKGFPTDEQLIATAFHRNTMNNDEGGTEDEEFRVAAVIDRVNSTWEVWQGTTFGCVQCHSHTYDPITHEEYYKYMAFFNNTRDEDVTSETPTLRHYSAQDSLQVETIRAWVADHDSRKGRDVYRFLKVVEPKVNSHDFAILSRATLLDSKYLGIQDKGSALGPMMDFSGKRKMLIAIGTAKEGAKLHFYKDSTRAETVAAIDVPKTGSIWRDSILVVDLPILQGSFRLFAEVSHPKATKDWVAFKWIALQEAFPGGTEAVEKERKYVELLSRKVLNTPILWEGEGDLFRKTHVFERGNWLVKGDEVAPAVPALFPQLPADYPKNRLGLAKWMVSRDNPLTARVIVNRFWEQLFGLGLVETLEDFGSQGASPSHPELLDWLAVQFMEEYQWSVKKLLRAIALSATYQQSSESDAEKNAKDPENRWLSRGPRVRLGAEQVRDQALAASGLLSRKRNGPSVMPPQPEGIWLSPYNGEKWVESKGEDKYRRALYTYWKRTSPYPSMTAFDAPSREFCQSRRIRTNTPLQALVTLNDPVYLEAAERIAEEMYKAGDTVDDQLAKGYRLLTHKRVPEEKLAVLKKVYEGALLEFEADTSQLKEFLTYTDKKTSELAALAMTANVLLNLDEVITKE
jgi:hypothetical protein